MRFDLVVGRVELANTDISVEGSEIFFRQTFLDHIRSEVEESGHFSLSRLSRKTVIEELGMKFTIVGRDVSCSNPVERI